MAGGTGKAAQQLQAVLEVTKEGKDRLAKTLSTVRAGASDLKMQLAEANSALQELREEPYTDAAIGAAFALAGGAAAGAVDMAIGPIFTFGGEDVVDSEGKTVTKGGIKIMPSLIGGAGLVALGAQDKNKSLLDGGKAMLAGYAYGQTQEYLAGMFTQ